MYAYCTSSHMSKQFKKWPIKYHFGWLSWPAKIHIKYCTLPTGPTHISHMYSDSTYTHAHATYICAAMTSMLRIVFENVQQKHSDKTIFDQQIVNFVQKPVLYPFMAYEIQK